MGERVACVGGVRRALGAYEACLRAVCGCLRATHKKMVGYPLTGKRAVRPRSLVASTLAQPMSSAARPAPRACA